MGSKKKLQGYVLGFVAAASYGLNPLFALPLMDSGMDTLSILFFRYLMALPVLAVMALARGRSLAVTRRQALLLVVFGVMVGYSSVSLFESYRYMDAGIASTILFVYPLMVALLMAGMFHERVRVLTWVCLAVALAGIALLYKGDSGATLSATGTAFVMTSALAYAIYIAGVNRPALSGVATLTVTFYVILSGLVFLAVTIICRGHLSVPPGAGQWAGVAALALLPTAVSFLCTTMAVNYIGSTPTAILGAMEPVTAVVIGVTVFGEQLTPRDVTGLVLIIVAVIMVIAGSSLPTSLNRIRRLFPRLRRR